MCLDAICLWAMCDRLADLRHDRYDGHAGGKGEGKNQSHEYLFHLLISPAKGIIETTSR